MRRLIITLLVLLCIIGAALAFFPMRLAIGLAGVDKAGFAAQQVSGSIWNGRLENAQFRGIDLGNLDAGLEPSTLLGKPSITVRRANADGEEFTARLSGSAGKLVVEDAMGDIPLAAMSGRIPVSTAHIDDGNITLDNGRCVSASGNIRVKPSGLFARFVAQQGLLGTISCQGDNLSMQVASAEDGTQLLISIDPQRRYVMTLVLAGQAPELAIALQRLGFAKTGDKLSISHSGVLR